MSLVINTNVASLNAQRSLQSASELNKTAMERLSSGKKVNSASDDAAGFAIIERQTSQIRGLNMAIKNANDGLSVISTVDQAAGDVADILQRLRELNIQAQNGTNGVTDLAYLRRESEVLVAEIDRIAEQTTFNEQRLMDGALAVSGYSLMGYPYAYVGSGSADDTAVASTVTYTTKGGTVSTTIASAVGNGETAKTWVQKVNATTQSSGLTASARTEGILRGLSGVVEVKINGVAVSWTQIANSPDAALASVNAVSGQTGVTAVSANENGGIYLIDKDGDDILVQNVGSSNNVLGQPLQAYSRNAVLISGDGFYKVLDPLGGTDTIRFTGTTFVNSDDYAQARVTTSTSDNTYGFTERERVDGGMTLQIGTEKGQSLSLHVDSFSSKKLGGDQVRRTSINIYDYGSGAPSLSGPPGSSPPHPAASFKVIDSVGNSYELDLTADASMIPYSYGSPFNWNRALVSAGLADKLQVNIYGEDDSGVSPYLNVLEFTAMEGFGDFDVVWSADSGHAVPSGFVAGQSIIDSSHPDHTQNAHRGTLSTLSSLSLDEQLKVIDSALNQVASQRAELGATTNRLSYTVSNLSSVSENTESARSQIQDADFAVESARLAKSQLLQTTATAMIAQANASGSMVLQLIR